MALRAKRERQARRDQRYEQLASARAPREELLDLTKLVDDTTRRSPGDARMFDLEGLLDHYAVVASAHARCTGLLAQLDEDNFMRPAVSPGQRGHLPGVIERRIAQRIECKTRAETFLEEIATTSNLVHLLAARCAFACAEIDLDGDEIDQRLARLDAEDELHRSESAPAPASSGCG